MESTAFESVITAELALRASRQPDYAGENRALVSLAQEMARSPEAILHSLVQAAMSLCRADSAAINLIDEDDDIFRWHALTGELASHPWVPASRSLGSVVDRNSVHLLCHPERYFEYFAGAKPAIVEALLIPFRFEGKPAGTIWVMAHGGQCRFDAEDARLVENLGRFAAAAYQLRSALSRAEEAGRRKDDFLAMLSHELRNPLAAMHLVADLFAGTHGENPEVRHASGVMNRQVIQLDRLIGDAVDVARLASGKLTLRKERVALSSIVERAIEVSRPMIDAAKHSLSVTLPSAPVAVDADPARLIQVFGNLLNNAAKFTHAGGHLMVSVEAHGDEAVIRVRDDGIGIAPGMLGTIFDLYAQAQSEGEGDQTGLGIGLTLSRSLVELHGGRMEALSAGPEKGSEFVVRLPLPATLEQDAAAPSPRAADALTQLRVLVVDDHRDTADALAWLLHSIGHEARAAYDGASALRAVEERVPDLVIQDLGLPHMNGYEIARRIRERSAAKDALLVALTGSPRVTAQTEQDTAFDLFVMKPLGLSALQTVLDSACARRAGRAASG